MKCSIMLGEPSIPTIRLTWGAMQAVKGPSPEPISSISSTLLLTFGHCHLKAYLLASGPTKRVPSQSKLQQMEPPFRRKVRLTKCLSAFVAPPCFLGSLTVLQSTTGLRSSRVIRPSQTDESCTAPVSESCNELMAWFRIFGCGPPDFRCGPLLAKT